MKLSEPPAGISEKAWAGSKGSTIAVGDLWLLSWDGEVLGLGLITGVSPSFVLLWPVSLSSDAVFAPAVKVETSPIGPIAIWPSRETGVGNHLLHRNLGATLTSSAIAALQVAFADGTELPLPFVDPNIDEDSRIRASDTMIDHWEMISLHTWPEAVIGETPFDSAALQVVGLHVSELQDALDLTVPEAVALFRGDIPPSTAQIELLTERFNVEAEQLVPLIVDEWTLEMLAPDIKDDLLEIAELRGCDEVAARSLVRSEFALAARSDGSLRSRLLAAIHRVLTASKDAL